MLMPYSLPPTADVVVRRARVDADLLDDVVDRRQHAALADEARGQVGDQVDDVGVDAARLHLGVDVILVLVRRPAGPHDLVLGLALVELRHHRVPGLMAARLVLEPAHQLERGRPCRRARATRVLVSDPAFASGASGPTAAAATAPASSSRRRLSELLPLVSGCFSARSCTCVSLSRFRYSVPSAASLAGRRLFVDPASTSSTAAHGTSVARTSRSVTTSIAPAGVQREIAAVDRAASPRWSWRRRTRPGTAPRRRRRPGSARRPIGMPPQEAWRAARRARTCWSASRPCRPGVSTWHGATAFTRTPRRRPLDARSLVSATTPALLTS